MDKEKLNRAKSLERGIESHKRQITQLERIIDNQFGFGVKWEGYITTGPDSSSTVNLNINTPKGFMRDFALELRNYYQKMQNDLEKEFNEL